MRLVAVLLGVVLSALPASAATSLDAVESELEQLGPVNEGGFLIAAYQKATLCACRDSGNVGHLTFAKLEGVSEFGDIPTFRFVARCVASEFAAATGEPTGPPLDQCADFEVLAK
jgi:hypothetical protein